MNNPLTSVLVAVISGCIVVILEYWVIKPLAEKRQKRTGFNLYDFKLIPPKPSGLAVISLVLGILGLLSNVIFPFLFGWLGGAEGVWLCSLPSLLLPIIALTTGLVSNNRSLDRYSSYGIATSVVALVILFVFAIFLSIVDSQELWCDFYPALPGCPFQF